MLFTAGLALACLAFCYWAVDVRQWRRWAKPFLVLGSNAIAAYLLAEIIAHLIWRMEVAQPDGTFLSWQQILYQRFFVGLASPAADSLVYALVFLALCWAAMWMLYRKRIFFKV